MGFDAARQAIEEYIEAQWADPPTLVWEASGIQPTPGTPWARITIRETDGDQITLGPQPVMRWRGRVYCDIFVPYRGGVGPAKVLGDDFRAVLERAEFGDIRCAGCTPQELGETDGWYRYQVSVPYYRDERSVKA